MSIITNLSGFTLDIENKTVSITPGWSFLNNGYSFSDYLSKSIAKADKLDTITDNITNSIANISSSLISITNTIQTFSDVALSSLNSFSGIILQNTQNMSSSLHVSFNTLQSSLQDKLSTLSQAIITASSSGGASLSSLNQVGNNLNLVDYSLNVPNGGNISVTSTNIVSVSATVNMQMGANGWSVQDNIFHSSSGCFSVNGGQALAYMNSLPSRSQLTSLGQWTMEFFMRPRTLSGNLDLAVFSSYNTTFRHLFYIRNNVMNYLLGDGIKWCLSGTGTTTITLSSWQHFAFQSNLDGSVSFFVNGNLDYTFSSSVITYGDVSTGFENGVQWGGHTFCVAFDGYIDTFRMSCTARYDGPTYNVPDNIYPDDNFALFRCYFKWDAQNTRWKSSSLQRSITIQQGKGDIILPKLSGGGTVNLVINYSGNVIRNTSDERLKKNITTIGSVLPLINSITPVEFDWINGNEHDYGFIAQDIQENFNKDLIYNVAGYLGFDQVKLIPYITKSIQEISETLEIIKQQGFKKN